MTTNRERRAIARLRKLVAAKRTDDVVEVLTRAANAMENGVALVQRERERFEELREAAGLDDVQGHVGMMQDVVALRLKAQRWEFMQQVVRDSFSSDAALRRRLACALGTSRSGEETLIARAAELAKNSHERRELEELLSETRKRVAQLEDELHGTQGDE